MVSGESGHIHLQLQDADGPLLDVEPEEEKTESSAHNDDEQEEEQDLESALQESRELTAQLREEVSALKAQLERERERVKDVWRNSCNQFNWRSIFWQAYVQCLSSTLVVGAHVK